MKKYFTLALMAIFVLSLAITPGLASAKTLKSGTVIKGKGNAGLYYLGDDGKRYVFPNDKTYFSWFDNFDGVEEIEMSELGDIPLGGNVRYKPGKYLVKIQTDPKVYAVGQNGKLRWIKSEKLAKHFYGNNWNKMVDDVPDSFFTAYEVGEDIDEEDDYDPDEEEQENPTISQNRGWKNKARVRNRLQDRLEKRCRYLMNSINRLQIRAERLGFEIPDLGEDYASECTATDNSSGTSAERTTICHKGQTITVAEPALRGHLRHGDTIGACAGDDEGTEEEGTEEEEEEEEEGTEEETTDETAPILSNIEIDYDHNSATITWTTDEEADSTVVYATESIASASSTMEVAGIDYVTSHSLSLDSLTVDTLYYYVIKSKDESGNEVVSDEHMFTTLAEPDETAPVISDVAVTPSETTAQITWTTDESATGKVFYSTEALDTGTPDEMEVTDLTTDHSFELTGLTASTTYNYKVQSSDATGNTTYEQNTFTTN